MLKRDIAYTDFNGDQQVEEFYFNIAPHEMIELEAEREGGFGAWLQDILKEQDVKNIVEQFKRIILISCGEKSSDGKRFVKSDEIRANFEASAAFISLYTEMISDEGKAAEFINAIIPKDALDNLGKVKPGTPATAPPVPPTLLKD